MNELYPYLGPVFITARHAIRLTLAPTVVTKLLAILGKFLGLIREACSVPCVMLFCTTGSITSPVVIIEVGTAIYYSVCLVWFSTALEPSPGLAATNLVKHNTTAYLCAQLKLACLLTGYTNTTFAACGDLGFTGIMV